MDVEVKVYCDNCGGSIEGNDPAYCVGCFDSLEAEAEELRSKVEELEGIIKELENQISQLQKELGSK